MTPAQQAARNHAVRSLTEMVRTYAPNLGEESRDLVREWIAHVVDGVIDVCTADESRAVRTDGSER